MSERYWKRQYKNANTVLNIVWTVSILKSFFILYLLLRLDGKLGGCF